MYVQILTTNIRNVQQSEIRFDISSVELKGLKELRHGLRILKVRHSQSVLIFSILNHPCSFFGCLLHLWCFSTLVNYYLEVSFNLKVILYITTNDFMYRDIAAALTHSCAKALFVRVSTCLSSL